MCCSVSPNINVEFSDTILYAAEVKDAKKNIVHVSGYQNTAKNNVSDYSLLGFWNKFRNKFGDAAGNGNNIAFPAVPSVQSRL